MLARNKRSSLFNWKRKICNTASRIHHFTPENTSIQFQKDLKKVRFMNLQASWGLMTFTLGTNVMKSYMCESLKKIKLACLDNTG